MRHLMLLASVGISWMGLVCPAGTMVCEPGLSSQAVEVGLPPQSKAFKPGEPAAGLHRRAEAMSNNAAARAKGKTRNDYRLAAALFQESARLFSLSHSGTEAAEAYLHAGDLYFTLSQYEKALVSFRMAFKIDEQGPLLRCSALSRMARTFANTGPSLKANDYSNQAMALCEALPNPKAQAEAFEARGAALYNSGDYEESARFLRLAIEKFAAAADGEGQARAQLMLAYSRFEKDRREGVRLAWDSFHLSSSNSFGAAQAKIALGHFAKTTGEWETALCNYKDAQPVLHNLGDQDNEASLLNGMGYTTWATGETAKSLKYFRQARTAFARAKDLTGEVEALAGIGKALQAMHGYDHLLPLYMERLRLAKKSGNPAPLAAALADLASFYHYQRHYAPAWATYKQSLAMYQKADQPRGQGTVLMSMAGLKSELGNYPESIALLKSARSIKDQSGEIEDVARIQYELARIYLRLEALQDALTAIEETIDIIESQRARVAGFDSRAVYFASVHKYYALYVHLLMLLDRQDPGAGFAQQAFDASERSKVRSLLDSLSAASQNFPCDDLQQRQREMAQAGMVPQPLLSKENRVPAWQQAQAELVDDQTVLLEYAFDEHAGYLWIIDKQNVTAHVLPAAGEIKELVQGFRNTLGAGKTVGHTYQYYARQLSRLLLAPVSVAGAKRLLIVPDSFLQYIPFQALPLPEKNDDKALLVSKYEVIILPSASALLALRNPPPGRIPPTSRAAVIFDPVFGRDDPRVQPDFASDRTISETKPRPVREQTRSLRRSESLVRLEGSQDEARAILSILGCKEKKQQRLGLECPADVVLRSDFEASRDYVLNNGLGAFRLLHFATHGIIDTENPEMSALILSLVSKRGRWQNGWLRLSDIYKLKLSADLVVLSACDTALGKDLGSEGMIGLPRAFLYAGAKSVVASLWKVDDEATARLMAAFYKEMQLGESPSSALRHAQLKIAKDSRWSEPYYWAAFVLQGDYKLAP